MIEERNMTVAKCDACGHTDYSDSNGYFHGEGYSLEIVALDEGTSWNAYACRENHLGKAARAAVARSRVPAPDAPPLPARPEDNGDATVVNP